MIYLLENDHIGLSETVHGDIDRIIAIESNKENTVFITPYDKARHLQAIDSKDEAHLTVWDKKASTIVGFIILAGLENSNLSLEFRRLVVESKGQGFGRQCLQLIKAYCFSKLRFHKLWLDVFDDNQRAINLYTSEGFRVDGHLRDVIKEGERYRTLMVLSILETEYTEMQKKVDREPGTSPELAS